MKRKISLISDLYSFFTLISIFLKYRFDIIHSVSPKSGLLAQLAAFISGIEVRIHTFTGQVWVNKNGIMHYFLKYIDLLIVKASSNILVDSYSQRSFLMNEGILDHDNSSVLLNGSISGINEKRFIPSIESYKKFRKENGMNEDAKIILFIGRLTKDKGILQLVEAFSDASQELSDCFLLIVGPDEEDIQKNILKNNVNSNIFFYQYTDTPEYFMQVSDVLCLPSFREGFGNVVLEAALCGIPSIVTDIYGLKDVVENNETAFTIKVGDIDHLSKAIVQMISNDENRLKMGEASLKRAKYMFSSDSINVALKKFYDNLLGDFKNV